MVPKTDLQLRLLKYFEMLTKGCGREICTNSDCISSGIISAMSPEEAALKALDLLKSNSTVCIPSNNPNDLKLENIDNNNSNTSCATTKIINNNEEPTSSNFVKEEPELKVATSSEDKFLTCDMLNELIDKCTVLNDFSNLRRKLGTVFSDPLLINKSFLRQNVDSASCSSDSLLDIVELRKSLNKLMTLADLPFSPALFNALVYLYENVDIDLRYTKKAEVFVKDPHYLNMFTIGLEILIFEPPMFEEVFVRYCRAISRLPHSAQAELVKIWSRSEPSFGPERLLKVVRMVQQFLAVKLVTKANEYGRHHFIQNDQSITAPVCLLRIFFYASLYGGKHEDPVFKKELSSSELNLLKEKDSDPVVQGENENTFRFWKNMKSPRFLNNTQSQREDALSKEIGLCVLDTFQPQIPFDEFYNEILSEAIEMDVDFANFIKINEEGDDATILFDQEKFSFMLFPFVLLPQIKMRGLFFFNRISMHQERRQAFYSTMLHGMPPSPHLRLRLRRSHVLHDALAHLEIVAQEAPNELKKQLFVEFEHEQAVDEGGVSKEFYQLVTGQLFNPDYGMFVYNESTRLFWFNHYCAMSDCSSEYVLIGMLFGLAIYNNIIVDVQFPLVLYKKLMGKSGAFNDLKDLDPVLYKSLQYSLEYEDDDFETVFFGTTFQISQKDPFGSDVNYDLIENGDQISVTKENRQDFVNMYANYLLNISIEQQYQAFSRGFNMVVNESPLFWLFRPDELDQIVCGCKDLDLEQLKTSTHYDNGYDSEHPAIKNFWSIVTEMSDDERKQLLQFATGSDRLPLGGAAKLNFIVARNGSDSDQLPTAQTCFNVLLLPEYANREKMQERLLKAIGFCRGFGIM